MLHDVITIPQTGEHMTDDSTSLSIAARSEQTEKRIRRYLELSDAADLEAMAEMIDDACEFHDVRYPPVVGKAALLEWAPKLFSGMTDQKTKPLVNFPAGDRSAEPACLAEYHIGFASRESTISTIGGAND